MKNNKFNNIISIISIIYTISFVFATVVLLVVAISGTLPFLTCCAIFLSSLIVLFLVQALDNALQRIDVLENALLEKKVLKEKDFLNATQPANFAGGGVDIPATTETVSLCEKCGYQLFPEDTECPHCKHKITKQKTKQ